MINDDEREQLIRILGITNSAYDQVCELYDLVENKDLILDIKETLADAMPIIHDLLEDPDD